MFTFFTSNMQGGLTPPFILPFQIPYEFIYNTPEENKTELTDAEKWCQLKYYFNLFTVLSQQFFERIFVTLYRAREADQYVYNKSELTDAEK